MFGGNSFIFVGAISDNNSVVSAIGVGGEINVFEIIGGAVAVIEQTFIIGIIFIDCPKFEPQVRIFFSQGLEGISFAEMPVPDCGSDDEFARGLCDADVINILRKICFYRGGYCPSRYCLRFQVLPGLQRDVCTR